MDLDGETVLAWLRTWAVEALLAVVALAGLAAGATGGGALRLVLGLALAAAAVDRVRLRMDNRSLAAAVEEAGERRVSAARRETPADGEGAATDAATHAVGGETRPDEPTDAGDP